MSHYFHTPDSHPPESSTPDSRTSDKGRRRRSIRARIWDVDYAFVTAPGVFSMDGLDLGTAVLLRECWPPDKATRLVDLGCGWGPIAVALAAECPAATVDAVDTNELALALTAENAQTAGVAERVRPLLPQATDPDVRYDEIWSNPPIRIGKEALHALLLTWLPRLAPGGVARLVVGRNLGADSLQKWLIEQGYACVRLASAKGFRVFQVTPAS